MIYGDFRVDFKVSGSCEASYPGSSDRSSSWTPLVRTSKRSFCGEVFSDLNEMGGLSTEERRHVDLRRDKVPWMLVFELVSHRCASGKAWHR